MSTLVYPTNAELMAVEQVYLPKLKANSPAFRMFPDKNIENSLLIWEQKDNYVGLQQVRGYNAAPPRVAKIGQKQYMMRPGVYGEHIVIDEEEITTRRRFASFNERIDVSDLVRGAQDQLLSRRVSRQEKLIWDLLISGYFSVTNEVGAIVHTDAYTQRVYSCSVAWGTAATSTPLADLRAMKLLSRGYSVSFGSGSTLWVNQTTANQILANTNASDLGGKRTGGFGTFNTLGQLNTLLTADDLPNIGVYDEGYYDDSSVFNLWIANGKGVLEGRRTSGTPIGNFGYTLNANNPDAAPGPYMRTIDRMENQIPRTVEVHDGFNGGTPLYFPSAVVLVNC